MLRRRTPVVIVLLGVVFPSVWRRRLKFLDLRHRTPGLLASQRMLCRSRLFGGLRFYGDGRSFIIGAVILIV